MLNIVGDVFHEPVRRRDAAVEEDWLKQWLFTV
jgi:hypothetical protein